ncbi:MAG: DNA polymerase [Rhodospirillaceae bacterium]
MPLSRLPYREIWAADFEFVAPDGERAAPVCMVARELRTGRLIRLWRDELLAMPSPPYGTGPDTLFVAYFASAEMSCHLALGWPTPDRLLDLFVEFRASTNGHSTPAGQGLLGALVAHGLDAIAADEKHDMRQLIMGGGPWSEAQRIAILDYCQSDVDALARLLPAMLPGILARKPSPEIALGQALLRGRYMAAVARMEWAGTPIDLEALERLRAGWDGIKGRLIAEIDCGYGIFDDLTFKSDRFEAWLVRNGIPWPRLPSGALDLTDDTFREIARSVPAVQPLRELRHALGQMRLNELAVGQDGKNRCLLSPFRARTGRNQPSNSRFVFGPSAWLRGLIKPPEGWGLAYVDFSSQEIGIAAALSGDKALMEAYQSGDVYLAFAKQAKLVPPDATKQSHEDVRDRCKAVVLGTNYGMGPASLANRIGQPEAVARELLRLHRKTYPKFWAWSEAVVDTAMLTNCLTTVFGWPIHIGAEANPRALMNYPMQGNGAEMMRLACCMATEAGLEICCPVHDALLLAAPLDRLDADTERLREIMGEASRIVLDGFEVRTDAKLVRYPDRYMDKRGLVMWDRTMRLLDELDTSAPLRG